MSVCAASQSGDAVLVTAYNPLGREARSLLRVPVESKQWRVDAGSEAVASEVVPRQNLPSWLEVRLPPPSPHGETRSPHLLASPPGPRCAAGAALRGHHPCLQLQDLQAVAHQAGRPARRGGGRQACAAAPRPAPAGRCRHGGPGQRGRAAHLLHPHRPAAVLRRPPQVRADAGPRTPGLPALTRAFSALPSGLESDLSLRFYWWNASAGFGQNSGAYIFRPNGTTAFSVGDHVTLEVRPLACAAVLLQAWPCPHAARPCPRC